MATGNKKLAKKINSMLLSVNKKPAIKAPAKKLLVKKAAIKKTEIEVVKKESKKPDPAKKTVAKNNFVKAAEHSVASGTASQKRIAKKTALVTGEKYKVKQGKKAALPIRLIAPVNDLIQHTTEPLPKEEKSGNPVFTTNQKDVYQNKIQAGNKSKSGIKPSGKKPLW